MDSGFDYAASFILFANKPTLIRSREVPEAFAWLKCKALAYGCNIQRFNPEQTAITNLVKC
jgi:hypothetical protein